MIQDMVYLMGFGGIVGFCLASFLVFVGGVLAELFLTFKRVAG